MPAEWDGQLNHLNQYFQGRADCPMKNVQERQGGGVDLTVVPGSMASHDPCWRWLGLPVFDSQLGELFLEQDNKTKIKPFHKKGVSVSVRAPKVMPWSILWVEIPLTLGINVVLSVSLKLSVVLSKGSSAGLGCGRAAGQGLWLGPELVWHICVGNICRLLS